MQHTVPEPVSKSLAILARHWRLFGDNGTTAWGVTMGDEHASRITEIFREVGAKWVLVGAHAVAMYGEPRATVDFDFIVEGRKINAVLERLREEFGELDEQDIGAAVRLKAIDIDLIRSTNHALFAEVLSASATRGTWTIPSREGLIALKFLSTVSPWRNAEKRMQDATDMVKLVNPVGVQGLDMDLLLRLGARVYPGAETELEEMLRRIDAGEPLTV